MKLVLIDGNSIINRAYYAIPPLNDSQGRNVNAVYGFINIYFKAIETYKPTHILVAFDKRGDSFRKHLYSEYKANRKGMPDDLATQMQILQGLLKVMNINFIDSAGVEADDIIGTFCKSFNCEKLILSGDKDLFQLVDDSTTMLLTKKGITEVEIITPQSLISDYNMKASQVIDYKALRGDSSDNIPGVRGIGEKSALTLLTKYETLDNIYANITEIGGAIANKLIAEKEMAYVSKLLATIKTDYTQLLCNEEKLLLQTINKQTIDEFHKLQFRSLIKKLDVSAIESSVDEKTTLPTVTQVVISNSAELQSLTNKLILCEQVAIYIADAVYLSSSVDTEYKVVVSDNFLEGMPLTEIILLLSPLFSCGNKKVCYDSKQMKHYLEQFKIQLNNVAFDISIMQYLVEYRAFKDILSLFSHYNLTNFACGLFYLSKLLSEQLKNEDVFNLYTDIELPLAEVLYQMETDGVKVNTDILNEINDKFTLEISELTKTIWSYSGEEFNILSPKQLGIVLFDKLKLVATKKTKTGYSTDADVLEKLSDKHPIVPLILKIRQLSKLKGTYLDGIKPLISSEHLIHTTYNQTLTSTGRLSSSEPNMQNLPVRDDIGRELRKMFIPRFDLLISADYSQIELRLLAHFSQDKVLIDTFNSGKDIHALVASELMSIPIEMVTSSMRRMAKAVNFGIIYGISEFGLSQNTGISYAQAKQYITKYFERFPSIKAYLNSLVANAKETGYVTTITSRRRQLPEIKSSNPQLRAFGERAAMNMPLQGSAADIMKIAMIRVANAIKDRNLQSKLIMQVHDELVIDTVKEEEDIIKKILEDEMEGAIVALVRLEVNISCGSNLYEAK